MRGFSRTQLTEVVSQPTRNASLFTSPLEEQALSRGIWPLVRLLLELLCKRGHSSNRHTRPLTLRDVSANHSSDNVAGNSVTASSGNGNSHAPLDDWEDDLRRRYPEPDRPAVAADEGFRNYDDDTRDGVREFYRLNHKHQTLEFARAKRAEYLPLNHRRMSIWEAMEFLNTLIDDSDPDIDLPQIEHLIQTAEALRHDGHPRWFILTGLIHDLGKILCLFGEPQWAVVGDTFPLGCGFSEKIVHHDFFADNADLQRPEYQARLGIYEEGCGLDNVCMSWGYAFTGHELIYS